MSMEPSTFAEHARWLARHRRVVPLDAYVDGRDAALAPARRPVALTFDDGLASVHEHAFPLLTNLGLPATVFLVAKTMVEPGSPVDWVDHPPAEPLSTLTVDQVREMRADGIRFESHSYRHADLTAMSFADCVDDLRTSREVLEEVLGHRVRFLAYPRGRHNADVRSAAAQAGFTHAFALPDRREEPGPYAVPRVGAYHDNSVTHLRLKLARPYLAVRSSPALSGARRVLSR
jgi:peptidoglycan/xylan/chitin deacetylase (PgdA/CDA1 family)